MKVNFFNENKSENRTSQTKQNTFIIICITKRNVRSDWKLTTTTTITTTTIIKSEIVRWPFLHIKRFSIVALALLSFDFFSSASSSFVKVLTFGFPLKNQQ